MPREALRETLARLDDELQRTHEIDDRSRELLARIARDIEELLQRESREPEGLEALGERLRAAVAQFEESHPALTTAVGRVADALASLGI
jgi:predicted component of type VI protein secretion system